MSWKNKIAFFILLICALNTLAQDKKSMNYFAPSAGVDLYVFYQDKLAINKNFLIESGCRINNFTFSFGIKYSF